MRAARIACTVAGTAIVWIGRGQPIARRARRPAPRLDQRPHALLEEERVALGALDQQPLERRERWGRRRAARPAVLGALRRQRVEAELAVVGLAAPAVLVLGPVVHEQQQRAVGRLSTRLSSSAWVSASIQCRSSKTSEQRLHLALAQQQPLDGIERALPALRRDRAPATRRPRPARRAATGARAASARRARRA